MSDKIKNKKLILGWQQKAEDDLAFAEKTLKETEYYDHVCFLSQQAVEKYLKILVIINKGGLAKKERTHNLVYLAQFCKSHLDLNAFESHLRKLTNAYIPARYPGNGYVRFSKKEAKECFESAKEVVDFIKRKIDFSIYQE